MRRRIAIACLLLAGCSQEAPAPAAGAAGLELPDPSKMSEPDLALLWPVECGAEFGLAMSQNAANTGVPVMTIYDGEARAIEHHIGYVTSMTFDDGRVFEPTLIWRQLLDAGAPMTAHHPELETVARFADPDGALQPAIAGADAVFVQYTAEWCAPCKLQSARIKTFRNENPDLDVVHVAIEADLGQFSDAGQACPIALEDSL